MPSTKPTESENIKTDIGDWPGGMDIDLGRTMADGQTLESALSKHVKAELDREWENQEALIKDIAKWQRQFKGRKKKKSTPWANCFSRDTQVLSDRGWIDVEKVGLFDVLYSMDRQTKFARFVPVVSRTETWAETMIEFKSKSINLCVTEDHNIAVQKNSDGDIGFTEARFLLPENRVSGRKTGKSNHKIPLTSIPSGVDVDELYGFDADLLLEFIGWYLAEGWTYKSGPFKKLSSIGIAQTKQVGRERIRLVLTGLGLSFSSDERQFIVSVKDIPINLRRILAGTGRCNDKFVPREFMNLGPRNLSSLLFGLISGDGCVSNRQETKNYDVITYYTTSERLADDVQEIAQKIGMRATKTKRPCVGPGGKIRGRVIVGRLDGYVVSILNKKLAKIESLEIKRVAYNDVAYCFTVEPYHTVYVRRNGIAQWCGQCSNIAVPITRSAIETVFVRIVDSIFNRRKPVIVKAKKPEFQDIARETENALEWLSTNIIKIRKKLLDPLLQQLKVGTAIVYLAWEDKRRTIYRWAEPDDGDDVVQYKVAGSKDKVVKDTQSIYSGPNIFAIPREDFIVSSDATDINDAYLVGFRKKYRKSEIDLRVTRGLWRKEGVAKLLSPDQPTDNEQVRADNQGKELEKTEFSKPYELFTVWVSYDVDEDGEPDDIMLTIHRETGAIVRAIYSPTFTGQRPFVKIVGNPTEYSFDGEGLCEILYPLQEEIDSIHNQRLDRATLANTLVTLTQDGSKLENFKFIPGKNYVVDGDVDKVFREVQISPASPDMFNEEMNLIQLADRVSGNTSAVQGQSNAERPVFKEAQLMLGESNKKFKSMVDNIIACITEIYYQLLELYSQYDPVIRYQTVENGKVSDKSLTLPIMNIRDGLDITLAASSDIVSQEARREMNNNLYMMGSDYSTKLATVAQALTSPQVPPEFKKFLFAASKANAKFYQDVLADSERPDYEELSLDLGAIFTPEEIQRMLMPPPPPPMPGPPGPGGPSGPPPGGPQAGVQPDRQPPPEMMEGMMPRGTNG